MMRHPWGDPARHREAGSPAPVAAAHAPPSGFGPRHRGPAVIVYLVGFLASIPLDTLTAGEANVGRGARCPIDERVGDRGLADAGLPGDEHDLPFTVRHPS